MIKTGAVCLAYETVERVDGSLPLLVPKEVAGRMAIQEGAKYLEKPLKGRGILLGGVPGVMPAKVLILVVVWSVPTQPRLLPVWVLM